MRVFQSRSSKARCCSMKKTHNYCVPALVLVSERLVLRPCRVVCGTYRSSTKLLRQDISHKYIPAVAHSYNSEVTCGHPVRHLQYHTNSDVHSTYQEISCSTGLRRPICTRNSGESRNRTHDKERFAVFIGASLFHLRSDHTRKNVTSSHIRPRSCPKLAHPP